VGPAQYLADTPEGAWAEFLRHEGITDIADLAGISRSLWAVEVDLDKEEVAAPNVDIAIATGGLSTYEACQAEAARLRSLGATALMTASAAVQPGTAGGQIVGGGELRDAPSRDGRVLCLFGARPETPGHRCVDGSPPELVLAFVHPLTA
jgi:hypothetical protein